MTAPVLGNPIDNDVSGDTPILPVGVYASGSTSVGTTATVIVTVPGGYNGGVLVQNTGTVAVLLGDASVTSSTGLSLAAGATATVPGGKGVSRDLYGITASSTADVTYLMAD